MMRTLIPRLVVPLCLVASVLASCPWLRSFPADVIGVPLFAAAVLSVLLPLLTTKLGATRLWTSVLVDLVVFVAFALIVVLHEPLGFGELVSGLYHGPSQLLTFALPLVSPRSLMVAPVALTWLAGAITGECAARRWTNAAPFGALLVSFGLAYAATVRGSDNGSAVPDLADSLLAGGLLLTLLLLRAAQTWLRQDEDAEATQSDGILPLRGVLTGLVVAVVVSLGALLIVQAPSLGADPTAPQRVPPVNNSQPLSPVSFIRALRPADPDDPGQSVFTVRTSADAPGYFEIANVDVYDGSGWSFDRTFRPSGGVLPEDTDLTLTTGEDTTVTADFHLSDGQLAGRTWMPYLYRPQSVSGIGINTDPDSGMIVPTTSLPAGSQFSVRSSVPTVTFDRVPADATADTLTPAANVQLPPDLALKLGEVISALSDETGVSTESPLDFLRALQADFRQNYSLPGVASSSSSGASPSASRSPSPSPSGSASRSGTASAETVAGSTSFADVAASILGSRRTGTPEQYATLIALIARQVGVPARVCTGFRVLGNDGVLAAGSYDVTTAQAWTWVEVPVSGHGWVVLDASPGRYGAPPEQPSAGVPTSALPSATPTSGAVLSQASGGAAVAPESEVPHRPGPSNGGLIAAVVIAIGALLLALAGGYLARKPLRSRRRRLVADPRQQVLGAWAESIDVLTEFGLPPLDNLTNTEITALAAEHFGPAPGQAARLLAERANAAVYSTRTVIAPGDADVAWRAHDDLRREVSKTLTFGERVAARLRYHRTGEPEPLTGPASWAEQGTAPQRRDRRRGRPAH